MDKKNTMLLTVIAVATLLVAVVGATFAYFAISTNTEGSNTTITGSTPTNEESFALTGTNNIKLNLSAENMAQANSGKYYFATTSEAAIKAESSTPDSYKLEVGKVTMSGGEEGATYECTADYTVTINPYNIEFDDTKDEAKLFITGDDGVTVPSELTTDSGALNLTSLNSAETTGVKGTVKFKLTSADATTGKKLYAALQIKNASEERQEDLAGKSFTINLNTENFACQAVSGAGA